MDYAIKLFGIALKQIIQIFVNAIFYFFFDAAQFRDAISIFSSAGRAVGRSITVRSN